MSKHQAIQVKVSFFTPATILQGVICWKRISSQGKHHDVAQTLRSESFTPPVIHRQVEAISEHRMHLHQVKARILHILVASLVQKEASFDGKCHCVLALAILWLHYSVLTQTFPT